MLDIRPEPTVLRVRVVEPTGQTIFVGRETTAGLEKAKGLAVDAYLVRRTTRRLDGIGGIERGVRRIDVHEVAFQPVGQMAELLFFAPSRGSLELQRIVVDADDSGSGEPGDLDQRAADAATQIHRGHAGPEPQSVGNVVLVARERRGETLAFGAGREMEGLAPAVFEEIGDQVVVRVFEIPVARLAFVEPAPRLAAKATLVILDPCRDTAARVPVLQDLRELDCHREHSIIKFLTDPPSGTIRPPLRERIATTDRYPDHGILDQQSFGHALHVLDRDGLNEPVAAVEVVDTQIVGLHRHEKAGNLGGAVEGKRK